MVSDFLLTQRDYIYYCCGLAFLLLACMVPSLDRAVERRLPWLWLGLFGVVHAVSEWLELAALVPSGGGSLQLLRLLCLSVSFLFLVEFGRSGSASVGGRRWGRWVHAALLSLASLGALAGPAGLEASVRYALGLAGAVWSASVLLRAARRGERGGRSLAAAGVALGFYALVSGVVVPRAPFFPASVLNAEDFQRLLGFPVQLLRGVAAVAAAAALWRVAVAGREEEGVSGGGRQANYGLRLGGGLGILLLLGWTTTEMVGEKADSEIRSDLLRHARVAAAAMNPERVQILVESSPGLESPDYLRIKAELVGIREASPHCRFCYLLARRGGNVVFLADSEPPDSPDYSPPGQSYPEASEAMTGVFLDGIPALEGPTPDRWGVWITGMAPVRAVGSSEVLAVLGMDTDARDFQRIVALLRLVPISITLFASLMVLGFFLAMQKTRDDERHLQEREARFRTIVNTVVDALVIIDHEGRVAYWNPAAEKIFGYSHREALGRDAHALIAPQRYQDAYRFGFDLFARTGEGAVIGQTLVMDGRRKDGSEFPVELSIAAFSWMGRWNAAAVVRDVSERKRTEEALRGSEEKYRSVVESVTEAIFRTDRRGRWTFLNPAWTDITGYSVEESLGRPACGLLQKEDRQRQRENFALLLSGRQESLRREFRFLTRGGEQKWIEVFVRRSVDEGGLFAGTSGTLMDITERHEVDRLKSEFVSTVSHELRTPLTSIQGSLGLLLGGVAGPLPEQARSLVEIATNNSERLVRLINDILDMEKIESGRMAFSMKPLEISPLVRQGMEAMRAFGEQFGVSFVLAEEVSGARVKGDPDRLTQVLANLLSNAAKFSPRGGAVTISLRREGDSLRLDVSDEGPGIPEEFRPALFQRFAQEDSSDRRKKGGTGLGLSISKAIVEKHGGTIGFTTEVGKGTTFTIRLPEVATPRPAPAAGSSAPRLLICQADGDVAQTIRAIAAKSGFEAEVATSAAEARRSLAERDYAVAALDLLLPDADGIDFIRELRAHERTRNLPVVVISTKAIEGREALAGDSYLVMDWLDKPVSPPRLIAALRRAAEQSAGLRHRILHVEDDRDVLQVVSVLLKGVADVTFALTLESARALLQRGRFDLVILDLDLPDGSGLQLLPLIRTGAEKRVPVVVFSSVESDEGAFHDVEALLVKSKTSNRELMDTVRSLLEPGRA